MVCRFLILDSQILDLDVADDIIDGGSKVLDVLGVESSHGDTSVIGQVAVVLLLEDLDLRSRQSRKGEHSNLINNVVPGSGGSQGNELVKERLAHGNDSVGHGRQVLLPLLVKCLVVQDKGDNTGSIGRRVGDDGTLGLCDLGLDRVLDLGGLCNNREVTGTLRVETKVLGERLGDEHLKAALDKVTDRVSVLIEGA